MKILISGVYGTSRWRLPFFAAIADAMEADGHQVYRFHAGIEESSPSGWQKLLERCLTGPTRLVGMDKRRIKQHLPWSTEFRRHQLLLDAVARHRPELMLVITYVRYPPEVLRQCRAMGVRMLVGWFIEGPQHEYSAESEAPLYDRYFCIHQNIRPEWRKSITHLPAIALNRSEFHPLLPTIKKKESIAFIGNRTERRSHFLAALRDLPLKIWGPGGWDQDSLLKHAFQAEFIWGADLNRLYNEVAIVLNISTWDPNLTGLTQRILDVPASGAFLITDDSPDLQSLRERGFEMVTFSSPDELRAKCLYYLSDPEERLGISDRSHRAALLFPEYAHIATQLVAISAEQP